MKEHNNPTFSGNKTPGALLRSAREEKGMSVVDVAARLCLSVQFIEDIERDDYSHLSATTYARGYVRSYAHLLGIPEETIVTALDNTPMEFIPPKNLLPLEKESRIPITQPAENSNPRSSLLRWGSVLVLLILAGLVVMWWRGPANTLNSNPAATGMTNIPLPTDAPAATANPATPAAKPQASQPAANQTAATPANSSPSSTAVNLPLPAPSQAPAAPRAEASSNSAPAANESESQNNSDNSEPINTTKKKVSPELSANEDSTPVQPSEVSHSRPKATVTLPAPRASDND